jgi:hypothetical protein
MEKKNMEKFKIYYLVFARSALSISGLGRSLKLSVEKIAALYKKAASAKRNYIVRPLWRNTRPSLLHVFSWPPFWRFTAFNKSKHPCCKNLFATAAREMRARELPFTPASSALALITSVPALSQRARPFLLKATEKEGSQQTSLLRTASSVIFQNIVLRPSIKSEATRRLLRNSLSNPLQQAAPAKTTPLTPIGA